MTDAPARASSAEVGCLMLLVVADTNPLRYLVDVGQIEILRRLFERIIIPDAVYND